MKTNSKLYKRVLAIALAVCMLCSVLVTGIGVGLKAKAEATTETKSFTNDWSWSYSKDSDTNYTTTYGCDAFKSYFDGYTWTGSEKVTVSFKYAGLHEGCSYTLGVFILNGSYSGINYTETITEDGTANLNLDATWLKDSTAISTCQAEIYVPIADKANLDGVTLSDVTFTVEGIVVDDTTDEGGDDTTNATANVVCSDGIGEGWYCQVATCTINGTETNVWSGTAKNADNEEVASVTWDSTTNNGYVVTWDPSQVSDLKLQFGSSVDGVGKQVVFAISNGETVTIYYDDESAALTTEDPNPTSATANVVCSDGIGEGWYCQVATCTINGTETNVWSGTAKNADNEEVASVTWDSTTNNGYVVTWDPSQVSDLKLQFGSSVDGVGKQVVFAISNGETVTIYYDDESAALTTEDPNASEGGDDNTGDDTTEETDPVVAPYKANMSYGSENWATSAWAVDEKTIDGPGVYTFSWNGSGAAPWLLCVELPGTLTAPSDIKVSKAVVYCDGEAVYEGGVFEGNADGNPEKQWRYTLYNVWGQQAFEGTDIPFSSNIKVELTFIDINEEAEYGTPGGVSGDDTTDDDTTEDDTTEEPTEGIVPNDNGYYHDRGAIFVYTGTKYDIHDFVLYGGVCLEEQVKDGSYYKWSNDWSELAGKGIYIKYWNDYLGIGYPAIQLSWRTEMTEYLGTCIRSADWTYNDYNSFSNFFDKGNNVDGSDRWYYFGEGSYESAEDTTTEDTATQNPAPTTDGVVNVTGDGEYYTFLAIGADNNSNDWHYSWAGLKPEEEDDSNKIPDGITVEAVNAKIGEQFTISVKTETPVAYTWYVAPTIIVGADKTNVDAKVVAVRIDGKDVTDTINFAADDKSWWYEDTGLFTKANNDNKEVAVRLAGGFNEWGTKYMAESPAGYSSIEYDIIINSVA